MIARIKNLRLRAIIGINDWERKHKQDLIINLEFEFDGTQASRSDHIDHTVDYKKLTKQIIHDVEQSEYFLLEKLADHILDIVMRDQQVLRAIVEVDKPQALRFADSVSITSTRER